MIEGLRGLARRVDRILRPGGRGLILLYHRVVDEPSDPFGLCVSPSDFEEHMASLRTLGRPMAVAEMARAAQEDSLPDRALGITFDDAYVDVLENAVPILERHDIPATVFVTTGRAGREREFWWDELESLLLRSPRLPRRLEIEIGGETHLWDLEEDAELPAGAAVSHDSWHILDDRTPSRRHAAFRDLYHLLRPLPAEERVRVMDTLVALGGGSAPSPRPSRRVMTPDEVDAVAAGGLVDVGAHTMSHPDLTSLSFERRRQEIRTSKRELEAWIGSSVDGFAYPYGHYDEASVEEVRQAGFQFACAGDYRALRIGMSPLLLPRVDVIPGGVGAPEVLVARYLGRR